MTACLSFSLSLSRSKTTAVLLYVRGVARNVVGSSTQPESRHGKFAAVLNLLRYCNLPNQQRTLNKLPADL